MFVSVVQRIFLLIGLNIIGACVAIYQTQHFYALRSAASGFQTFCQFGKFDCIAVEASPYAEFILGLPLSGFVVGWLLSIAAILFLALNEEVRRDSLRIVLGMVSFGVLMGAIYFTIMVNNIGSFCLFCLILDGINILSLVLVFSLKSQWWDGQPSDFSKWQTPAIISVCTLLISLLVLQGAYSQATKLTAGEIEQVASRFVRQEKQNIILRENELSIGPKDAKIVIVKYSDFQCPACETGARIVNLLKYKYPKDILFISRNYPLDSSCNSKLESAMHPFACYFAKAAICANEQGQFAKAYTSFFENQSQLSSQWLDKNIKKLELNEEEFKSCMALPATLDRVKAEIESGNELKVESTPTFFINGRKMSGAYPVEIWDSIIEKLLKE